MARRDGVAVGQLGESEREHILARERAGQHGTLSVTEAHDLRPQGGVQVSELDWSVAHRGRHGRSAWAAVEEIRPADLDATIWAEEAARARHPF